MFGHARRWQYSPRLVAHKQHVARLSPLEQRMALIRMVTR